MDNNTTTVNIRVALAHFLKEDVTYNRLAYHLVLRDDDGVAQRATSWTVDKMEVLSCLDSLLISSPMSNGNFH